MKVQVISFHCILKNRFGKILSSTFNQDVLTGGPGAGEPLLGLMKGLQNLQTGEKRRVDLNAAEAYGFYDPKLVFKVPKTDLPEADRSGPKGNQILLTINGQEKLFRVVNVSDEFVLLDGNHPLAGQDLVFEIEATSVRDATDDDIGGPADASDGLPGAGVPPSMLN